VHLEPTCHGPHRVRISHKTCCHLVFSLTSKIIGRDGREHTGRVRGA
jgi:hypothetical protein